MLDRGPKSFTRGWFRNFGATKALELFGKDATFFFTDIDVFSSFQFLRRCQTLVVKSRSAYFPIIWSQKKPVGASSDPNSTEDDPVQVDDVDASEGMTDNGGFPNSTAIALNVGGFWRDFSYGVSCIKASDLDLVEGYPHYPMGGYEDEDFYRSLIAIGLTVFRLHDSDIAQKWHPNFCSAEDLKNTKTVSEWMFGYSSTCEKTKQQHLE